MAELTGNHSCLPLPTQLISRSRSIPEAAAASRTSLRDCSGKQELVRTFTHPPRVSHLVQSGWCMFLAWLWGRTHRAETPSVGEWALSVGHALIGPQSIHVLYKIRSICRRVRNPICTERVPQGVPATY